VVRGDGPLELRLVNVGGHDDLLSTSSVVARTASVRRDASAARRYSSASRAGVSPSPSKVPSWIPPRSPASQIPPPKRTSVTPASKTEPSVSFEQNRPESRLRAAPPSIVAGIRASRVG